MFHVTTFSHLNLHTWNSNSVSWTYSGNYPFGIAAHGDMIKNVSKQTWKIMGLLSWEIFSSTKCACTRYFLAVYGTISIPIEYHECINACVFVFYQIFNISICASRLLDHENIRWVSEDQRQFYSFQTQMFSRATVGYQTVDKNISPIDTMNCHPNATEA